MKLSQSARQSLEEATLRYEASVDLAGTYLAGRGISREVAGITRLGFVVPGEAMPGHEQYEGRLVIPFITPTGVIDMRFRSIVDDDSPKYMSRPGSSTHLYNVTAFGVDSDVIAICEGEIDTITAHYLCGIPAVGLSGAQAWKDWYSRAFHDYRRVLVLADGDQPGRDLGKKIAQQIDVAVVVSMPDGHDVNSFHLAEGAESLRKRVGV